MNMMKPCNKKRQKEMLHYSIVIVTVCAVCLGVCLAVKKAYSPSQTAVRSARTALRESVDPKYSVDILSVSRPDSVFGRNFVTDEEKMNISMLLVKVNEKVMEETSNLENVESQSPELTELMERQISTMGVLRSLLHNDLIRQKSEPFRGWKVKIHYRSTAESGSSFESEYWCLLDRSGHHVLQSFEIPILTQ